VVDVDGAQDRSRAGRVAHGIGSFVGALVIGQARRHPGCEHRRGQPRRAAGD
jgi:hypothetical protein